MPEPITRKIKRRLWREIAFRSARNPVRLTNENPYISFTFDDFFHSGWALSKEILGSRGFRGTYYTSYSLLNKESQIGSYYTIEDIKEVLSEGHEIGCHTFSHISALDVSKKDFIEDIRANLMSLSDLIGDNSIESFSYPFGDISPALKKPLSDMFSSCRIIKGGVNRGSVDLNMLKTIPLVPHRTPLAQIFSLLESAANSWILFYTHDISDSPSKYGCTPDYFESVVAKSSEVGGIVLPVKEVVKATAPTTASASR
jgi:hypothetical protein